MAARRLNARFATWRKNPIILGILLGVPFSLLRVKLPDDSFLDAQYHWRHGDARRAAGGWRVFLQWGSGQMREARTAGDGHQAVYSSGGFSAHRGDDGLHRAAR